MRSARQTSSSLSMMAERSKSLPFLLRPVKLDGTLAGDEGKRYNIIIINNIIINNIWLGFDPLGLSNINEVGLDLYWMREAELKHARVAMLAIFGAFAQELGNYDWHYYT